MRNLKGFRFQPTDKELVGDFLPDFIKGEKWPVEAINEVQICKFDPWELPSRSRIKSDDLVWHFFSPRDSKYSNNRQTNRRTTSGFWKVTGPERKIWSTRGDGGQIGIKKTLVFHKGQTKNKKKTQWVIHEYHTTSFRDDKRTHVVCKLMFNGEKARVPSGDSSEQCHPPAFHSSNVRAGDTEFEIDQPVQENSASLCGLLADHVLGWSWSEISDKLKHVDDVRQPDDDEEFLNSLQHVPREDVEYLFAEEEKFSHSSMPQKCNGYKQQKF